jgi:hypothetical protein
MMNASDVNDASRHLNKQSMGALACLNLGLHGLLVFSRLSGANPFPKFRAGLSHPLDQPVQVMPAFFVEFFADCPHVVYR